MRAAAAVLAIATLTVAASACGDDDDDGGATATSGPAATAAPTTSAVPASTGDSVAAPGTAAPATPPPDVTGGTAAPTTVPGPAPDPVVAFTQIAELVAPVDLAWRTGDDGLYVAEQGGRVVRVDADGSSTVLDISDLTEAGGERGLLGVTFAPGGELAYVNYTDLDGWTIIAEYPVDADGTFQTGDSARLVMEIEQPYPNHNGGDLTFGPDGMLYIGMGDGGSAGDPGRRATDLSTPLGKLLRIDPTPSGGGLYTVPADNPFVGDDGAAPEIWASGLRNPWRFSFDRETGDLWIADVGQGAFEEIDVAPATGGVDAGKGLSFGWSAFEGDARFNGDVPAEGHTPPIITYDHGAGCSVSGGTRARGTGAGTLAGWYVYGDYCSGTVWALEVTGDGPAMAPGRNLELGNVTSLTAVVDGPDGELYALSQAGPVLRLDDG